MGDKWEDFPKVSIDVLGVSYRLFRHPELYSNVRVEMFLREYWYNRNTGKNKRYENITGWEMQAMAIYKSAYESGKKIAESRNG